MSGLYPIIRRPRFPLDKRPRIIAPQINHPAPCPSPSDFCGTPDTPLLTPDSSLSIGAPSPLATRSSSPLLSYLSIGAESGCPPDQLRNFLNARIVLQPKQLAASAAARLCDRPDGPTAIGFGGARGGGKSFWLLAQMGLDDCQRFPGLKCLLLRKVGKANLENFEDLRRRLFGGLAHEFSASRATLTFANGSRILAGHFQCDKDIDAYLGLEYDVIGIEEATTLSATKYHDIVTCNRTSKPGWRPRIYSTANPGGIGHAYYRATYVTPFQQRKETNTRFIPATVDDNAFTNPEYRSVLDELTGWKKRAWREGDWDIAAGQFFTNFRREVHVLDHFDDHRGVEWFAALDYGFTHYTAVLLACADSDGNIVVVDEYADRFKVPEQHAGAIKALLQRHKVSLQGRFSARLNRFVAGADVFARQSNGISIARDYARHGINLRPASTHRITGWAEILRRFGDPAGGVKPSLFIHRRCSRLIESLPALQHDPNNPEDVLKLDLDEEGIGGDDAADALRYLVATRLPQIRVKRLGGL